VPDALCPQVLRLWGKAQEGVALPLSEQPHGLGRGMDHPGKILGRVQAHIRHDAGQEDVLEATERGHGDGFPFQVADGLDPLRPEQFEASDVNACEQHEWVPRFHAQEKWRAEKLGEVDLAGSERWPLFSVCRLRDVLHLGESLPVQEFFGHILSGHTDGGIPDQPDPRRLRRRLRSHRPGRQAQDPDGSCQGQPTQKAAPRPPCGVLGTHRNLLLCAEAMLEWA
jgi:hypothetical protein